MIEVHGAAAGDHENLADASFDDLARDPIGKLH